MHNKYLVIGLGKTGVSVIAFLRAQGFVVCATDDAQHPASETRLRAEFPEVELFLGGLVITADVTHIVASPGVALDKPEIIAARLRGVVITGDIELFAQRVNKPVLAITGSNGKSTVTTLLGEMASASGKRVGVGGNLGIPVLDLLSEDHDCYVLELSSFQLELIESLQCLVVTVLNISPDHMDRYADLEAYVAAKLRIYRIAEYAVINREDSLTFPPASYTGHKITFGLDIPSANNFGVLIEEGVEYLAQGQRKLLPVSKMAMLGRHNVANALAALAMGQIAGFDLAEMLNVLTKFSGLEHRCEKVVLHNNVLWINDSKGTNAAATEAALNGLFRAINGKWVIILGGVGKNADFTPLIEPVRKYCKAAVLIGEVREELNKLLHDVLPCYVVQNFTQAIDQANLLATAGDGVLLSPACASFDMFNNYMHRGTVFKQLVRERVGALNDTTTAY